MNDEFRRMVIDTLMRGDELPTEFARFLFPPEKREYELVYFGKEREEDIIANTLAVPLQAVQSFGGESNDGWRNMLIMGDNLQVLKRLLEMKKTGQLCNGDGTPGVRLVYIDPPFATKQDFKGKTEEKAYRDKLIGAKFIEFLRKRLILIRELLTTDGSLYVHLDARKVHYLKVILDELFGESNVNEEIIWKRTSAHSDSNSFANVHETILFYPKTGQFYYKPLPSDYSDEHIAKRYKHVEPDGRRFSDGDLTGAGLKGGGYTYEWKGHVREWRCPKTTMQRLVRENRIYYTSNGLARIKRYLDEVDGMVPQDLWLDIYPVNSQAAERIGYPTQKPESLLERVINASSARGDIVLDAFAGSGTTCAVAEKLGRRWVGIDVGKLAIYTVQKRMLSLREKIGQKGNPLDPKPFTLYNAGLYDFSSLRELPWEDWRFFALQLFGCKDELHEIAGLKLDGKRQGASVLVFDHMGQPNQRIDEKTIQDIHAAIGQRIGTRLFIIAPRNTFDFQQDYIELEGIRYYALRIPYSFINELHYREFTALEQPKDETAINDLVDAVGFDFIRPPLVKWSIKPEPRKSSEEPYYSLQIEEFKSHAYIRGKETSGDLETLSMVMLDYDYDGDLFAPDKIFYAQQLQNDDWRIRILLDQKFGKKMMIIFMDIYGNEARELIPMEQLQEK